MNWINLNEEQNSQNFLEIIAELRKYLKYFVKKVPFYSINKDVSCSLLISPLENCRIKYLQKKVLLKSLKFW